MNTRPFSIVATKLWLLSASAFAASATWSTGLTNGDWNTAGNWTPSTVPDGTSHIATFGFSQTTALSVTDFTDVAEVIFNSGASASTSTVSPSKSFSFFGAGVTNNSGTTQTFIQAADPTGAANGSVMQFLNSSSAGNASYINQGGAISDANKVSRTNFFNMAKAGTATFTINGGIASGGSGAFVGFSDSSSADNSSMTLNAGAVSGAFGGNLNFFLNATAGNATITLNGGTVSGASGAVTTFSSTSTAANAVLTANGGTNGGTGASIRFIADSTGGTAQVQVFGNANLTISGHNTGVTIGPLAGTGNVFIGAKSLTVGSNDASTTFSGAIQHGGIGSGGSLTKIGAGTLKLSGANTYSGSTTVSGGTLEAAATGALGSTSNVTVSSGGTLLLSNTATTNRINNSATVTMAGGTIAFSGNVTEGSSPGTGALTLTANSIIDFAGGNAVINFGASGAGNPNPWTAGVTPSIYNWSGSSSGGGNDQLIFGSASNSTSLTSSQLAQILFYDGGVGSNFLGAGVFAGSLGEVVPVPEPSSIVAGLLALGFVAGHLRRTLIRSGR